MKNKNSTYLFLTILLVILSTIGGYFLFKMYQGRNFAIYTSSSIPKIELIPTDSVQEPIKDASTSSSVITPTIIPTVTITVATATATPKNITPTTKLILTPSPIITPVTSKNIVPYQSVEDGFSVSYNKQRQFLQDTDSLFFDLEGNKYQGTSIKASRYNFKLASGDFAIHVTPSHVWTWKHPNRKFDNNFLVAGRPTFVYKIAAQTIIDVQSNDKNYTLQCIHNGIESLKNECDQFVSSFKLL